MNPFVSGSPALAAFALTLLHSTWQCLLIAASLWLVLQVLPRTGSSLRYGACCAALAAMPATALATFWRLLATAPSAVPSIASPAGVYFDVYLASAGAWALGCATMSVRLAFGVVHLQRVVKRAVPITPGWQARVDELAGSLGLRRHVRLLASSDADSPLLIGWLRPVILIPLGALTALPPAYIEALLLHELGHARRLDYLVNLLQACIEALLFYHPAVYWVSACLRAEREHCCDDLAIAVTRDRLGYARALAAMETWRGPCRQLAPAANGGSLRLRIERIVGANRPRRPAGHRTLAAASAFAAALLATAIAAWSCADPEAADGSPLATAHVADSAPSITWLPPSIARWQPVMAAAARQHGVSPQLLAIVMLVESWGDPRARGNSGAVGLMQLMPATAANIAAQRELADYSLSRLWDPAYNIDFGAWLLAEQLRAFELDGDRSVALAAVAYNGGAGVARAYLESESDAALFPETVRYRDLVVGMWKERDLAESQTFEALSRQIHPAP